MARLPAAATLVRVIALSLALAGATDVRAQAGSAASSSAASIADRLAGFRLEPPSSKPQTVDDHADFPWLAPLAGSTWLAAEHGTQGLDVTTPEDDETHVVGTQTLARRYARPADVDDDTWLRTYARALRDAGWTLAAQQREPGGGTRIVAHYAAHGRDLWARLAATRDFYELTTADVGDDLAHVLSRTCRITVYGIDFVTDRPDLDGPAEPVLMELRQLLRSDRSIELQVVVHLDASDVADDPAGARRLAQQRAEAIRVWLARHRIDIGRITATGAGADHPVDASDTVEHRARNRRVELVQNNCRG